MLVAHAGAGMYDEFNQPNKILHGVLGVEMETAALYTIAARHRRRALTVCAVSDSLVTHEQMDPAARQSSLREMAERESQLILPEIFCTLMLEET